MYFSLLPSLLSLAASQCSQHCWHMDLLVLCASGQHFCLARAGPFGPGKGFLVSQLTASVTPLISDPFGLLLAPLPYSSHAVPHTGLLFQLWGVTKRISHLFPFFSPSGEETIVSFSHAPFTSASGRFTPLGFLAAAAAAALSRDLASSCPILTVLHSQGDQK